jgi:hypothetical protein
MEWNGRAGSLMENNGIEVLTWKILTWENLSQLIKHY